MQRMWRWLRRERADDPPADQDRLSNLPFLRQESQARRGSGSGDGTDSEMSLGSGAGFSFGHMLRRINSIRPSAQLLKLTDPDKGERTTMLNRGELWTPDRGSGFYQTQRARSAAPHLVTTGRYSTIGFATSLVTAVH